MIFARAAMRTPSRKLDVVQLRPINAGLCLDEVVPYERVGHWRGVAVDDIGLNIALFQIGRKACQAEWRHDVGYSRDILSCVFRPVTKGVDQEYPAHV